jgi:hypothetical protein
LRAGTVHDLQFLDDDDQMKMMIDLMKFALKAMTLAI